MNRVPVDVVLPLRAAVLRPGLPVDLARYEQDLRADTVHLAAVDPAGQVVGCATWNPEPWEGRPGWRLRGMATSEDVRGRGIGALLVQEGLSRADPGAEVAWCNARTAAISFYERLGFTAVGEVFDVQHAGPHRRMWRSLP